MTKELDPNKTVVLLSGGMDSATLLWLVAKSSLKSEVRAISIWYGQRHWKELDLASELCQELGIPWKEVRLPELQSVLGGNSLTDHDMKTPHGHYADESMKNTVVPNRNMILLSIAAGYAISEGMGTLAYGAHSGDHAIYPDCRPDFVVKMGEVLKICHYEPLELSTPFIYRDKANLLELGLALDVPYHMTWTCYEGNPNRGACGKCGSCVERVEAFKANKTIDPMKYAVNLAVVWVGCRPFTYKGKEIMPC